MDCCAEEVLAAQRANGTIAQASKTASEEDAACGSTNAPFASADLGPLARPPLGSVPPYEAHKLTLHIDPVGAEDAGLIGRVGRLQCN